MAKYSTLTALFTAIANSLRSKTGSTGSIVADDFPSVIDSLSTGGITPTGTKSITTNGTHDVTSYASAQVNVPTGITPTGTKTITTNGTHDVTSYASASVNVQTGITPTGTKTITANGTHDVTNFASALVDVAGLNARVFTGTVASDTTSGNVQVYPANEFLASIRSNSKAFALMIPLNQTASTAMYSVWMLANFTLMYTGSSAKKAITVRTTTAANNVTGTSGGMTTTNYSGYLSVDSNGSVWVRGCNTTYPVKAGDYMIIAGIAEML